MVVGKIISFGGKGTISIKHKGAVRTLSSPKDTAKEILIYEGDEFCGHTDTAFIYYVMNTVAGRFPSKDSRAENRKMAKSLGAKRGQGSGQEVSVCEWIAADPTSNGLYVPADGDLRLLWAVQRGTRFDTVQVRGPNGKIEFEDDHPAVVLIGESPLLSYQSSRLSECLQVLRRGTVDTMVSITVNVHGSKPVSQSFMLLSRENTGGLNYAFRKWQEARKQDVSDSFLALNEYVLSLEDKKCGPNIADAVVQAWEDERHSDSAKAWMLDLGLTSKSPILEQYFK